MTAATPKIIPSAVKMDLILLSIIASTAIAMSCKYLLKNISGVLLI
jgi:hypothetical protein